MAKGGTANNKQTSGNKKKRRFLQQAHPITTPPSTTPRPSNNGAKASSGGNIGALTGNKPSAVAVANNNKNSDNRAKRRGPPLQTNKSIDELETILERRWGTAQTKAPSFKKGNKADDDGADFVLSFGSEDDFEEMPRSRSSSASAAASPKNNLKGAAVFRSANRVMDPWAEEEGIYNDKKKFEKQPAKESIRVTNNNNTNTNHKQRYNRQEAMLNRVRSNQERVQSKKQKRGSGAVGNTMKKGRDETIEVPIDVSRDYYDEDDEGFEGRNAGNQRRSSNKDGSGGRSSSLISPKPVGGKGSFAKSSSMSTSTSSTSSLSGGIFSDRSSSAGNKKQDRRSRVDAISKEDERKRTKKPKRPQSKPMLDENGKEMFLTLEQAEDIVQGILRRSSEGDDDSAKDDDAEFPEGSQWEDIGITDPTLLRNLQSKKMSCPAPLPVQDKACPPIIAGNDVLVSTHTGSGKTLAFLSPIAQILMIQAAERKTGVPGASGAFPKAIVVAPGRELASQIVSVAATLFEGTGLTVAMAIGGTPYGRNVEKLRKKKPDLVVGTPGRIAELVIGRPGDKTGKMKISGLQAIVLDEFDALLQYDSHKEPTMAIMQAMDRQHGSREGGSLQRVLCSATATDMMASSASEGEGDGRRAESNLIEQYLRPGYAHASVDDSDLLVTSGVQTKTKGRLATSARVSRTTIHGSLHVPHQRLALETVRRILNTDPVPQQVLIFVDSPRRVDIVIEKLARMDIIAAPLHGGGGKNDRSQVSKALREGFVGIVVATEMAARGIDAPYLTHVINLDLPTDASHYAHRAGRCGRGGRPGVAVSITCDVRERGVPRRFAEELGIVMHDVEAREGKLRIIEG